LTTLFERHGDVTTTSKGFGNDLFFKNEMAYATVFDEDVFLKATRKCLSKLLDCLNVENKEFLMIDQFLPASNLAMFVRYFDEQGIKVFVVERDPRDLYLSEKLVWKGGVIPNRTVDLFCDWFKWTRGQFEASDLPPQAMKIQFEDLIYKYDETISKIFCFAGMDAKYHTSAKSLLNPDVSMRNTRLWERFTGYENDMEVIESKLKPYCYYAGS
jgi:hypothetical protein